MNDDIWVNYFGLFDQWVETASENPKVEVIRSIYMFGTPI